MQHIALSISLCYNQHNKEMIILDEYMSLDDAAQFLKVDRSTLYRWAKIKKLMIYKQGRHSLVKKSDVQRIQKENEEIRPLYE